MTVSLAQALPICIYSQYWTKMQVLIAPRGQVVVFARGARCDNRPVCGRYVLASPGAAIAEHSRLADLPAYPPRYNIAPTQDALVVRETPGGSREAVILRWGLI